MSRKSKIKDVQKIRGRKKERKRRIKQWFRNVRRQYDAINIDLCAMNLEEIFKWVENINTKDKQTEEESTEEYIGRLLDRYFNELGNLNNPINNDSNWNELLSDVESLNNTIIECLDLYARAKIGDSIIKFHDILQTNSRLLSLEINPANKEDQNWYRMRMQDEENRVFEAKEMFHVPFNLRHKVSLARYSVSGYPCLYISRSVWATWEEMHEPKLSDFSVSRMELQGPFEVLDLRVPVWDGCSDDQKLVKQLYTIPLVLACSVKVKYPKDNFKPEYIIPQLVMLAIAYDDVSFMGCAYTSTRRNPRFTWQDIRLLDNIALPVKMVNMEQKLCPKLRSYFKVSDSTNYDYELLKKPYDNLFWNYADEELNLRGAESYDNSVFGQIERRLLEMEVILL